MHVTKIEPNEKYIIVIPEVEEQEEKIADSLESFLTDDIHTIFFIHGKDITVIPSSQVVGYKRVSDEKC